jgi:hypothetical protein
MALNDYATLEEKQRFQSMKDVTDCLSENAFLAKVDLQSAYRSVKIHPSNFEACGLKWRFRGTSSDTWFVDTCLPFGSRLAPGIFNRLSQAVRRMMLRLGFSGIVVYLDDFLVIEPTKERCILALNTLIDLLRQLGFSISWKKVEGPSQRLVFLGVLIDSVEGCLSLPLDKLASFHKLIKDTLELKRISLKELQHLAGKLNWAASVVRGGRIYLRRVLDLMKPLHASRHKVIIPSSMKLDLEWWDKFLAFFNGKSWICRARKWVNVYVDACNKGGGMQWDADWHYVNWEKDLPEVANAHINVKETLAIGLAVRKWAPMWVNSSVVIHTDNTTALCALNKGSSRSSLAMEWMREVFWLSNLYNFSIRGVHIPGVYNVVADAVSRLHMPGFLDVLESRLGRVTRMFMCLWPFLLRLRMSYEALLSIIPQVVKWVTSKTWMQW